MWGSAVGGIVTLLLGLLVAPLTAVVAQPREKVPRVGYLNPGSASDPLRQRRLEAFRHGLRELGYVDGQNITIEPRWAEGQYERYPALAADLVRVPVDVIVTNGGAATKAAQDATRTIPIVMSVVIDPIGSGLVSSLAHPGGNVTGHSLMASDLVGKQLELLKEVVPTVARVALLWNPANPGHAPQVREAEAAAQVLGVQLHMLEARVPQDLDSAFAAMTRERADALLMLAEGVFTNQLRQIAELATQRRLPSIYGVTEYAEAGGLMVYTANFLDLERRAATYVDKILRGAKPGDLPVEQPTTFELVINLKTAQALGITIPPRLLFQADKVIQ
jgi:putative ABC transport system substrate-binding protein